MAQIRMIGHVLNPPHRLDLDTRGSDDLHTRHADLSGQERHILFALPDRTMLLPGWYAGLRGRGFLPLMPTDLREAAEASFLLNRDRNACRMAEAAIVSDCLAEIDCPGVYIIQTAASTT